MNLSVFWGEQLQEPQGPERAVRYGLLLDCGRQGWNHQMANVI